jgi:alpha-amylase/alpha-mannosidase (GH57 family)
VFAVHGAVTGSFATRVPWVQDHAGLSAGQLGLALAFTAFGASCAMPLAGRISHRFGSRTALRGLIALWTLSLVLPSLAPNMLCFFRDDRLSDLIGFEYRKWHSGQAAAHFVGELEAIASAATSGARPLVCVIVDGENAWEYYPYNGYYFVSDLYARLAKHALIRARTCRDVVASLDGAAASGLPDAAGTLPGLVAGSWVYGDFMTWIGSPDKNRAWDLLAAAKAACDEALASGRISAQQQAQVSRQLAVCEGSDWFWWFGDYNPADAVARFDALYRANLRRLYEMIGVPPPAALAQPVSAGSATAVSEGAIRRAA